MKHVFLALFLALGLSTTALAKKPKVVHVDEDESIEIRTNASSKSDDSDEDEKANLDAMAFYGGLNLGLALVHTYGPYGGSTSSMFLDGRLSVGMRIFRFLRADASFDITQTKNRDHIKQYFYGYNFNVYGQFPIANIVTPFMGLGLGWLNMKMRPYFMGKYETTHSNLLPILTLGLDLLLPAGLSIGGEVRYQSGKTTWNESLSSYQFSLNLKYFLNI
ncbi:MAG: outer membrane beta-barrel protein [Bacteriovoracaceae bacterium]|nr:outer membrane beta-barrel protein [Bacteriovoracaceae bacterium]